MIEVLRFPFAVKRKSAVVLGEKRGLGWRVEALLV